MASILMPFILLSYALFRNFFSCFIADMLWIGSFSRYKFGAFGLLVTIETAFTHKSERVEPLGILFSRTGSNE